MYIIDKYTSMQHTKVCQQRGYFMPLPYDYKVIKRIKFTKRQPILHNFLPMLQYPSLSPRRPTDTLNRVELVVNITRFGA